MAKEIERIGIPVALITALHYIAQAVGASRIIPGRAIQHPLGEPSRPPEAEKEIRHAIVATALNSLSVAVSRPTIFEVGQYSL